MSWVDTEEDVRQAVDFRLWKRLFAYTRPYRKQVRILVAAGMTAALSDAAFPLVARSAIDAVAREGAAAALPRYAAAYLLLTACIAGGVWTFIRMASRLRTHISHDIRRDAFAKLQELSFSYYDRRPVGWLMARMTSDCERLSNVFAWGILDLFWASTLLCAIAAAMFVLDARLALLVLAILPFLVVVSVWFRKRILESARRVRRTNSLLTAAYNEGITGVRTAKAFAREKENLAEFAELSGTMRKASVENQLHAALYLPVVVALGSVAAGVALATGGTAVVAGGLTVGTVIAFLAYTRLFFEPVNDLAHWFAELQMAQAAAERILDLVAEVPEVRDSDAVRARLAAAAPAPGTAPDGGADRWRTIEFRNVGFAYRDGPPVLRGFDLLVEAGETVALVGETGGGKTTIVSLLARFYEATEGAILVDGTDLRERGLAWWQGNFGVILQTPYLFSGTVAANLRYGKLDATREEMEAACRVVGAHDFVAAMPKGYDTNVGEGGVRLSTGQKQLLSFARAILKQPRILVMDEATSSVDTETEQKLQRALSVVLEGRTSFVIAHRLSTIRNADRIVVIDGGRIVEEGDHRTLLARKGSYPDLYTKKSVVDAVRTWS